MGAIHAKNVITTNILDQNEFFSCSFLILTNLFFFSFSFLIFLLRSFFITYLQTFFYCHFPIILYSSLGHIPFSRNYRPISFFIYTYTPSLINRIIIIVSTIISSSWADSDVIGRMIVNKRLMAFFFFIFTIFSSLQF